MERHLLRDVVGRDVQHLQPFLLLSHSGTDVTNTSVLQTATLITAHPTSTVHCTQDDNATALASLKACRVQQSEWHYTIMIID